jgi:hypothetical protein
MSSEAKAIRNARNKLFRRMDAQCRRQLTQVLTENKDKLIELVMMGGALRVGIETAVPDEKLVNLDGAETAEPVETPPPSPAIEIVPR